jgi:hypothetical protein
MSRYFIIMVLSMLTIITEGIGKDINIMKRETIKQIGPAILRGFLDLIGSF